VSKGVRFWGFRWSRVRGVLGGISSIPLGLASFGRQNLGYGLHMRCSYYPQSLAQFCGAIREIGSWIWGVDPRVLFIPRSPGHTGLNGASHRSDRCQPLLGFARVKVWVSSVSFMLLLFRVWVSLELGRPVWCFGAFWLGLVSPVCCIGLTAPV
jgi:hypothetical protein